MKRNKHSLSHYHLTTGQMGKLIPVGIYEVLPGDTVQQATSLLCRVSPLIAPVMHPVSVRIHHWFVPHRLVWEGWEDFITGGPDGMGGAAGTYPQINGLVAATGDLADYFGVPTGTAALDPISALPFRSYNLIWNEFYRDQDLEPETSLDGVSTKSICWEKDYFTSARPWPQKGPDVTLPLGTTAPVIANGATGPTFNWTGIPLNNAGLSSSAGNAYIKASGAGNAAADGTATWNTPNLLADLSQATAVDVNTVRLAFALQRYQEARARYGSRYTEYLRFLGVRPSDARLQRPEYLGGGKQTISFSEVLRTGNSDAATEPPIGDMSGHGIAAMRSRRYRRFFEEHGFVISLLSVRPRTMYTQGLDRMWHRFTKEDYWQRELEQIGQQEIYEREVYVDGTNNDVNVFGYADRYAEYKHQKSRVSAEFRQLLNYWHMSRDFAAPPVLNGSFVNCDPTKRIYAEQTQDHLWMMVSHSIQARRMVSKSNYSKIV